VSEGLAAATAAAGGFAIDGPVREVRPHPGGHIHRSYIVTGGSRRYLLQGMNTRVFTRPEQVMENVAAVTAHLASRGERTLVIVRARNGDALLRAGDGGTWRMFEFLEHAVTRETARDAADAEAAADAFGRFQRALADYHGPPLHVTIPRFHDTAARVEALDRAVHADASGRAARAAGALAAVDRHRTRLAPLFGTAASRGDAVVRIAHHDAKIANVLFDARTSGSLCVVDLDTVMPGLSLYDFGDLVRSTVSPAAEDERDVARIAADPARYAAIVRGYLRGTGGLLAPSERALLPAAAEAMVFEQAVRFVTDFLEGDRYYPVARAEHNLDRATAQLALLESLVAQRDGFHRMVAEP